MRMRCLLLLATVALPTLAPAATFTVDTTADSLLVACSAAAADCSLRGAITLANATADADSISFDIPPSDAGYVAASGHWRIAPASALPDVQTGPLTIDGYTQPGASASNHLPLAPLAHQLKIELRGPNPASINCLQAITPLTVRGLALNNCSQALFLFEPGPHVVEGNYIGTDISGQTAIANRFGIALGGDVRVGGPSPAQANLISANRQGALVQFRTLTRLRVQGNVVGSNAGISLIPGVQDQGVVLNSTFADAVIGGAAAYEGNVIVGSGFAAVYIFNSTQTLPGAPQAQVMGNVIGLGANGLALGNGRNPLSPSQTVPSIQVLGTGYCRVGIGGESPGEGNLIAHGGNAGIAVGSCWSAPLLGNRFVANRGIPIDLASSNGFDGRTPNDPGDVDGSGTQPGVAVLGNRFQNTAAVDEYEEIPATDTLRIVLRVDATTSAAAYPLRLDFYATESDGTQVPMASGSYGAADAQLPREYTLPLAPFRDGVGILVTDAEGNSSELLLAGPLFADGFEDRQPGAGE